MTRGRLSVLIGIFGLLAAGTSIVLMLVMGSVFADARTENITGPGVDIFVRTPFPGEGGTIRLDVEARGGSRAGIGKIEIRRDGHTIAVSESKTIGRLAKRTVLSDNALSVLVPILEDVTAWMIGEIIEVHEVYANAIIVVRVTDGALGSEDDALLYHERQYMKPLQIL